MSRRSARGQSLPPEIKAQIRKAASESRYTLRKLLASLYEAGWTLRSLGEAFDPVIPRTTIREWVQEAPEKGRPEVVGPELRTPPPKPKAPSRPPIAVNDRIILRSLTKSASEFRAGMSSFSIPASANVALNNHIRFLRDTGHSVQEIADAAGLSRRAVYNRLKKTEIPK